ncbi:signal-transducing adaptor protein 2 [Cygnus atratus]|uniref:signal-transducing adaptor protein 2 n=1 Tax=Cygnus atratus TaxID=8868 RepID=UPI0021B7A7DE|nr:signal-transducing adaptor protein 2 [Cygnus atratus]
MAPPVPPPQPAGARHYYEGFVQKRGPRDMGYRRVWAGLRGPLIAFYAVPRDRQPLEMLDLSELVAVRAEGGGLVLQMRDQNVTLKVESAEAQEMWRGFILTMAEMKVPSDLVLLPGHRFQLLEALREEQERRAVPRELLVSQLLLQRVAGEAEQLLERSAGSGNLVLRPGGHGHGVSVTTRQMLNNSVLIRHYKVIDLGQDYCISVDVPHYCSSLAEVVQYFVEKSKGSLRPLHSEYNQKLEFVETDGENGEMLQGVYEPPPSAPDPQCPPPTPPPRTQAPVLPDAEPPAPHRPRLQPPEQDITEELLQKLRVRRARTDG